MRMEYLSYGAHDGVPSGGEDISAVAALVIRFQLLGEVISGELLMHKET